MTQPVLGTAHLFALVPPAESERLVREALDAGFVSVDTAPSYGYGRSEACVGRILRSCREPVAVATKVGILAQSAPSRGIRTVKAVARRLPGALQSRLRGAGRPAEHGRFAPAEVRASVEESLRRLRHIDRLLLHEVHVDDLTDELLIQLDRYRVAGDVGAVGLATSNEQTDSCLARAPELFTAANISIAPSATPVALPTSVTRLVGHGVFGAGGADLARLRRRLRADSARGAAWQAAATGTPWGSEGGFADALVARAISRVRPDGVIVASSSIDRLQHLQALVTSGNGLPPRLEQLLDDVCDERAAV